MSKEYPSCTDRAMILLRTAGTVLVQYQRCRTSAVDLTHSYHPVRNPENLHYLETALVNDVLAPIRMHSVISVCLVSAGAFSCFPVRKARLADLRYDITSGKWH